jgi:hypothetical protein
MRFIDRDGDFNFPVLLSIPAIFTTVFAIQKALGYEDNGELKVMWLVPISSVLFAAMTVILVDQWREDDLRDWLLKHEAELAGDGADYHGVRLRADSRLFRFHFAWSLFVISARVPGRPLIEGIDNLGRARWRYNLVTLVLGWWYWSGPFRTIRVLWQNRRRGQAISVAQYLHWVRNPKVDVDV